MQLLFSRCIAGRNSTVKPRPNWEMLCINYTDILQYNQNLPGKAATAGFQPTIHALGT